MMHALSIRDIIAYSQKKMTKTIFCIYIRMDMYMYDSCSFCTFSKTKKNDAGQFLDTHGDENY